MKREPAIGTVSKSATPGATAASNAFSVEIAWSEQADRPLTSALFVSPSQGSQASDEPFREVTVITADEFRRLVEEVTTYGLNCAPGVYVSDEPQYFVQVKEGDDTWHCGLGFSRYTVEALQQMARVLEGRSVQAVRNIIAAIEPLIEKEAR